MHLEHKIILFVVIIAGGLLLGFGIGRQFEQLEPEELLEVAGIKKICYFDGPEDILFFEKVNFPLSLSTDHVTEGMYSLEVVFPDGGGTLSAWRTFMRDWSQHQLFSLDVYNDQYSPIRLFITINDEEEKDTYEEFFFLVPGSNRLSINLTSAGRRIDLNRIKQVAFSLREIPGKNTFFFDNIRLQTQE